MKTASKIFNIISIVLNAIYFVVIISLNASSDMSGLLSIVYLIRICIAAVTLNNIAKNNKSIALGVVDLLFSSLVGGILYLCWDSNVNSQNNSDGILNNNQQNYRNETLIPTQNSNQNYYDNLLLYNDINTSNVRYCRYCGQSMPVNAMFCSYCGKNQNTNDTQNFGNNILQNTSNEMTFRQQNNNQNKYDNANQYNNVNLNDSQNRFANIVTYDNNANNNPPNNNNETTVLTQNDNQNHCDNTIQHSDATVTDGRYCRYCGHKIPADALFCAYCGKNQRENNN